jgi:zinc transport system permease protein
MKKPSATLSTIMRGATMDELVLRALIGALILAAMLGPLGSFVVWRHMAYLGDTIAHAALLGIALSLVTNLVPMTLAMFVVAMGVALVLYRFARDTRFHTDTLLGILAHGTLALGVLLVALSPVRVDMNAYLFGDVLAISWGDVGVLALLACVIALLLRLSWRALLMVTIHPAIAHVESVNVKRTHLMLLLMLAAVIAVAIKLVGVLLITALMIMPAASARYIARTPAQMAIIASIVGMLCVALGLFASIEVDAPTGPTMVVIAAFAFVVIGAVTKLRKT